MNAIDFVKKHGWEAVINAVKSTNAEETSAFESKDLDPILAKDGSIIGFNVKIHAISYVDVKRLVGSHELVESKGGLAKCKEVLARDNFTWCSGSRVYTNPLEIAVADVESCKRLEVGDAHVSNHSNGR